MTLYEWNEAIQKMIDWLEEHITDEPTLTEMARQIGYSPYYCSTLFHRVCGTTVKSYIAGRRLALAALEIRDTPERIIDIAVKYGYSSQEALTRAFKAAFGCTPAAYRKDPAPIPLPVHKVIYFPEHYRELHEGGIILESKANIRLEYIPAHKYIGIWDETADNYCDFWDYHDCGTVCGIVDSLSNVCDPIVTGHTAGWYRNKNGERKYFYGTGVPLDYAGQVPEVFSLREFPGSYYLVFFHPPFDYLSRNEEVMSMVDDLAWNYNIEEYANGRYLWNEDACQCYQRHYPEVIGYEILRPVRLK